MNHSFDEIITFERKISQRRQEKGDTTSKTRNEVTIILAQLESFRLRIISVSLSS
jgi:hypothetical protein